MQITKALAAALACKAPSAGFLPMSIGSSDLLKAETSFAIVRNAHQSVNAVNGPGRTSKKARLVVIPARHLKRGARIQLCCAFSLRNASLD